MRSRTGDRLTDRGVSLTRLGLGTAPLGGWPAAISDADADETLRVGIEAGIGYVDTAPYYGSGLAEERVGSYLREVRPGSITLSTKVGRLIAQPDGGQVPSMYVGGHQRATYFDFSERGIWDSFDSSRERLGIDVIDVLLLHDPDDHLDQAIAEAYPALTAIRAAGHVRAIGAGMNSASALARLVSECELDCVLVAGRYSLLDQSALDELLPACAERNVAVIVGGVFNSGILAKPSEGAMFDYAPASGTVIERARAIEGVCAAYGVPLAAAAMQFPLLHPAVASVVVGMRGEREVKANLAHLGYPIPTDLWRDLQARGLLSTAAPTRPLGSA